VPGISPHRLCLLLFLAALTTLSWSADSGPAVELLWFSADEGELRRLPLDGAPSGPSPSPLMADRWFKPLPDIDVPLLDGGSFALQGDGAGSVLILDFWATWCTPCRDELPLMQALYDELRGEGLKALAINVQEPVAVALSFAEELGLTIPLGSYRADLQEAIPFSKLPLVVIIDRWGRMRARWDGYEQGFEMKIADIARKFLAEQAPPADEVAELLAGGESLRIRWSRETAGKVAGVTVVPGASGGNEILASVGRSFMLYKADGRTERIWEMEQAPGVLRSSPAAATEGYLAVAFRPGSDKLFTLRMPEGIVNSGTAPAPLFDAAPLDPSSMLLATYEGLFDRSGDGEQVQRLEGFEGVAAISPPIVLEMNGRLTWLDPAMNISARTQATTDAWRLLADDSAPGEVGVVPMSVLAAVTGRFQKDRGAQAAIATADGRLLLVDLESGSHLFDARWSGISDLAAGDLDGDGRDELVVGAGSRLTVLSEVGP
jgi:thiol-disulfide isomerase/thioredoxin